MANFNSSIAKNKGMNQTLNHEGATVHQLTELETLFSKVLGSFFGESTFYENRDALSDLKNLETIIQNVSERDKEYVLKIAQLGRMFNMIDYPLQILAVAGNMKRYNGESFKDETGNGKMRYYIDQIVQRTKDVNSVLSTQLVVYGKPIPKQLRKGLKEKLESYDMYKLSKGLDIGREISLKDSIKLLHPHPMNSEMEEFYTNILQGKVKKGNDKKDIQSELTKKGQTDKVERTDTDLIQSVYDSNLQTIVKNLISLYRNGLFGNEEVVNYIAGQLKNERVVLNSKLLPFRFFSAYVELGKLGNSYAVSTIREALEDAVDISIANVDEIEGLTAYLIDISSSMNRKISSKSSVTAKDIALLLGAIAYKKGTGDLFLFATDTNRVNISRRTPVFEIVNIMKNIHLGGCTDIKKAFIMIDEHAKANDLKYDNVIILSDGDCYGYDKKTNTLSFSDYSVKNADQHINRMIDEGIVKKVWINNLLGNDFAIVNTRSHQKNLITGFSEKFLDIINVYNSLGTGKDIRKVIDTLLEKELGSKKHYKNNNSKRK